MPLTPKQILELSEPVGLMYADAASALLINLAARLKITDDLGTSIWRLEKLSEIGALTQESVQIIARITGKKDELIETALAKAGMTAGVDVDTAIKNATRVGFLSGQATTLETSEAVARVIKSYTGQAVRDTNLVNTVMLESTLAQYRLAVQQIVNARTRAERLLSAAGEANVQKALDFTQRQLNAATGRVLLGTTSITQAVRDTIKNLAESGITGFIDRAGRQWSPEAYVNMDVRTTVHNTAVHAQRERAGEHGVYTFQITSHPGARPLCEPYQGGIYSWDGSAGTVYDLDGNGYAYEPIQATSYGEPAGIFGINCGHDPETFVDGYSIPRYGPTEDKEENDRLYRETQQQRAYERDVRHAKTEAAALKAAGDEEGFRKAAQKVKAREDRLNTFIREKNLQKRVYATQVSGYNRSAAASVNAAARNSAAAGNSAASVAPAKNIVKFTNGTDSNKYFAKQSADLLENTKARTAFNYWSNAGSPSINNLLRYGEDMVLESEIVAATANARQMSKYISKQTLADDIRVYRTLTESAFNAFTSNGIYSDKGFTATSTIFEAVASGAPYGNKSVWLEIHVPAGAGRGAYINSVSEWEDSEFEYLIHADAKFRITGEYTDDEGRRIIQVTLGD